MCGFVGMSGTSDVAPALVLGLSAIQHRGQDAAGLGTYDAGRLHLYKDLGMVTTALPPEVVQKVPGRVGISHVRYPTHGSGSGSREDAQPFITRRPGIVLAHNGNVTNVAEIEELMRIRGVHMLSASDSELILLLLADELARLRTHDHTADDVTIALRAVMELVRGSYSVVAALEVDGKETLLGFRDPHGIRPAVYGQNSDGAWVCASESVALDVLDCPITADIPPGSMVLLRAGEPAIQREVLPKPAHHCVFENIYFARPDSILEGTRVNRVRGRLGQQLAREIRAKGIEVDVVVPVPDTSRPAAEAISEILGIPNREGFIKNRYSGRTFIMPDQATREAAMRLKLNTIDEVFRDRRVLLVDDSVVRGTTMRRIIGMVRQHGPKAVHVGVFSPPVVNPCFYGIDMPSRDELVATRWSPETLSAGLAGVLGSDTVTYLSEDGIRSVVGERVCNACFTGRYVVPVEDEERRFILKERRG
ncbi:MAG: amidophosphoribosyltransferase [Myxococcota bacterium]